MSEERFQVARVIDDFMKALKPTILGCGRKNWDTGIDACCGDVLNTAISKNHDLTVYQWDFSDGIAREVTFNSEIVYRNGYDQQVQVYIPGNWEKLIVP